jgi:hypothetical protein
MKNSSKSRNEINDENIKSSQTQSQSQISQIETSDDGNEADRWLDEEINESWSQGFSDPIERDSKGKKRLSTISEGDEEEEEVVGQAAGCGHGGGAKHNENQRSWVEEGFFGDGGEAGFTVWRDRY